MSQTQTQTLTRPSLPSADESRTVAERVACAGDLIAAVEAHADTVAAGLSRLIAAELPGETGMEGMALSFRLAGRHLGALRDQVAVQGELLRTERARLAELRQRRDARVWELRAMLVDLRLWGWRMCGDAFPGRLGLVGRTPRKPGMLIMTAEYAATALAAPEHIVSDAEIGTGISAPQLRAELSARGVQLRRLASECKEAVAEADRTLSRVGSTVARQSKLVQSFDRAFSSGAKFIEGFFKVAGYIYLAQTIRPGSRPVGRPPKPETVARRRDRRLTEAELQHEEAVAAKTLATARHRDKNSRKGLAPALSVEKTPPMPPVPSPIAAKTRSEPSPPFLPARIIVRRNRPQK